MPRLSIVIPLTGNVQQMEDTLVSVLENRPDNCQVVVVMNEVYADPYDLKNEVCFVYAPIGCKPVECINRGLDAAGGEIVHILTAGAEVGPGWAEAAIAHFHDPKIAAVAPLILRPDDPHRVVSAGSEYRDGGSVRRAAHGRRIAEIGHAVRSTLGPDRLAGFYRKSSLDLVDRFSGETGAAFATVDLALKLREAGGECVFDPNCRVYAHESIAAVEPAVTRALTAERLFWRWAPSRGWLRSLPAHALCLAWAALSGCPRPSMFARFLGRFLGLCGIGLHGRHYRQMAQLRQRASYVHSAHAPMVSVPGLTGSSLSPPSPSDKAVRSRMSVPPRRLFG